MATIPHGVVLQNAALYINKNGKKSVTLKKYCYSVNRPLSFASCFLIIYSFDLQLIGIKLTTDFFTL
jgi:hypothetical protein